MRKFKLCLIWAAALLLPGCFTACQNEEDLVMQDDDETVLIFTMDISSALPELP